MRERILEVVHTEGPIPFERFMELALYDPEGGFFAGESLRSQKSGDFLTSPEVSPLFGETLAELVAREHRRIGDPFRLVEVAAGSGSLLRPLLRTYMVEAWAVEVSPAARKSLTEVVTSSRILGSLHDIEGPLRGVIIANELLDNLPLALAQRVGGEWRERWVGAAGDGLVFVDAPVRPQVEDWLSRFAGKVDEGGWVEAQLEAYRWVEDAVSGLEAGCLVLIDYGDTAENLLPRRRDGTLRTYRSHHLGPHPLEEPGQADITADVNFTAVEHAAQTAGAKVEMWRQDDFLTELGLRRRLSELRHQELEQARHRQEMARLETRTRIHEAETLLHRRGLGDFRVLVASKS